jgi:hypothetical protein
METTRQKRNSKREGVGTGDVEDSEIAVEWETREGEGDDRNTWNGRSKRSGRRRKKWKRKGKKSGVKKTGGGGTGSGKEREKGEGQWKWEGSKKANVLVCWREGAGESTGRREWGKRSGSGKERGVAKAG